MIAEFSPEDDSKTIVGKDDNGSIKRLVSELKRFCSNDRLTLGNEFFERFRRKPVKRDLLVQVLKEKGAGDEEITESIKRGNFPSEINKRIEDIIRLVQNADLSGYFIQLYYGQGILANPSLGSDNQTLSDAPYQFILTNNKYCANAGFFPCPERIEISQIQGFPGCERELEPLKWSRLLIRSIADWAESAGIPEVDVIPYKRNGWDKVMYNSRGNSHLIYDMSAKREGFSYDKERGLFVKRLSTIN